MNKEEFKRAVIDYPINDWISKQSALDLIDQLDEPERVVVPPFVADYIERQREYGYENIRIAIKRIEGIGEHSRLFNWFFFENNSDLFAKAWIYGYEVEKEKKYQVIIPNVFEYLTLIGDPGNFYFENRTWINEARRDAIQLTENEIKESFSWAWQFAEEVSE